MDLARTRRVTFSATSPKLSFCRPASPCCCCCCCCLLSPEPQSDFSFFFAAAATSFRCLMASLCVGVVPALLPGSPRSPAPRGVLCPNHASEASRELVGPFFFFAARYLRWSRKAADCTFRYKSRDRASTAAFRARVFAACA